MLLLPCSLIPRRCFHASFMIILVGTILMIVWEMEFHEHCWNFLKACDYVLTSFFPFESCDLVFNF